MHRDEREWETIRWPGQTGKMLFHPRPERPTEPNAGIVRYEAGGRHPLHHHEFAQVWYILSGEFRIGGKQYGRARWCSIPTRITKTSSSPRPAARCCSSSTRARRPAAGRSTTAAFNMKERKAVDAERTDL